jgi:hypothetical protein
VSFVANNSGSCGQYSYFSLFSCRIPPFFPRSCILVHHSSFCSPSGDYPRSISSQATPTPVPPFLKLPSVRGLPIWKGESGKFLTEIPKDLLRDGIRDEKGKHLMYPKNRLQERKAFWKIKCIVTLRWSYFVLKVGSSSA